MSHGPGQVLVLCGDIKNSLSSILQLYHFMLHIWLYRLLQLKYPLRVAGIRGKGQKYKGKKAFSS